MEIDPRRNIEMSGYLEDGFPATYDRYRPLPPAALPPTLLRLAQTQRPELVVDLGCGTGHSTHIWAEYAQTVVGVEPNEAMRGYAQSKPAAANVTFRAGFGHDTGLETGSAGVVTCSQSFHWMEPTATLAEIARILRPGGVFCAYDCDWPPTIGWRAEQALEEFVAEMRALRQTQGLERLVVKWPKEKHLQQIEESGHFRYVKEILLHNEEEGTAERLIGIVHSMPGLTAPLQADAPEVEASFATLRHRLALTLGDEPQPWTFSYRARIGIK